MKKTLILMVLVLAGCGRGNPAFTPYLERFLIEQERLTGVPADLAHLSVRVEFGQPSSAGEAGECIIDLSGPHIVVLESNWNARCDTAKEVLIFHELGHCVLGRHHTNADSIMRPTLVDSDAYAARRDYYVMELFTAR